MRKLKGTVVSNKMQKTVVVKIDRLKMHPKYQKRFHASKKYKAHAEGEFVVGDIVIIKETRPLSKEKRWKVVEKVGSINVADVGEELELPAEGEEKPSEANS